MFTLNAARSYESYDEVELSLGAAGLRDKEQTGPST